MARPKAEIPGVNSQEEILNPRRRVRGRSACDTVTCLRA